MALLNTVVVVNGLTQLVDELDTATGILVHVSKCFEELSCYTKVNNLVEESLP